MRQQFSGDTFNIVDQSEYSSRVPHVASMGAERIQVWDDPTEVHDYDQLRVVVDGDEVLVHEANFDTGQGTYAAINRSVVVEMVEGGIVSEA